MSVMDQYRDIVAKRDDMRRQIKEMSAELFREGSKALFTQFPQMKNFGWTQYTPYFNDGDPCVFQANTDEYGVEVNGTSVWDLEDVEAEAMKPLAEAVSGFLGNFTDEDFQLFFGDHLKIIVDENGVTTQEYEHD